ncbi:hypothetical protein DTO166G4_5446 [Paecilomyces variotii]|nr:hypothetical protein DTO166G4_5446 [Paecilomyces variotii]KAJ9236139.1 hypothetical protein DTO166G5_4184 [Paecilomyces variotii]KAJ9254747.1 hypothetical protein DTO195F2_6503 [Paecilomyces variotii]KAJ9366366.1 hypothetical protein DTO282E5_8931 [Paecilomyces variotii]
MARCPSDDVLWMIGEHIEDLETRYNLIQCSRRFHRLFLPLLYSSLSFLCTEDEYGQDRVGSYSKSKFALIQDLCRRPDLAGLVRHLEINIKSDSLRDEFDEQPYVPPFWGVVRRDLLQFDQISKEIWETEHEGSQWVKYLRRGSIDAWSSLLLAKLSHLRTMSVIHTDWDEPYFFSRVLLKAAMRQYPFHEAPHLSRLHTVDFSPSDEMDGVMARFLVPFFNLPAVRTISGDSVIDWDRCEELKHDGLEITKGTSPVTEIKLRGEYDEEMDYWFAACSKLETFKFSYMQGGDPHARPSQPFQAKELRRSLLSFRKTLKTLWITGLGSPRDNLAHGYHATAAPFVFGSFKEFSALRELRIDLGNFLCEAWLIGTAGYHIIDILPGSLEVLDIPDVHAPVLAKLIADFMQVIRERSTCFPHFKTLKLRERFCSPDGESEKNLDYLRGFCEENGIELVVHEYECPTLMELQDCICV